MPSKYATKLAGQRVLLLGGSSGIGFCIAEAALEQGADAVIIAGSQQSKLDAKVKELEASYPEAAKQGRIKAKTCDLSDALQQEANIVALLDFATENKSKKLDHVITTAGDGLYNPAFKDVTVELVQKSQTVRILTPLMLCKYAATYMHNSPASSLTFTSGDGTYRPAVGWTLMIMIGGALDALVRSAAVNLAPIRVNCVAPGATLTELWSGGQKLSQERAAELTRTMGSRLLTGELATPEDVAEAYLYFMKNRNVTGTMNLSSGGGNLK